MKRSNEKKQKLKQSKKVKVLHAKKQFLTNLFHIKQEKITKISSNRNLRCKITNFYGDESVAITQSEVTSICPSKASSTSEMNHHEKEYEHQIQIIIMLSQTVIRMKINNSTHKLTSLQSANIICWSLNLLIQQIPAPTLTLMPSIISISIFYCFNIFRRCVNI